MTDTRAELTELGRKGEIPVKNNCRKLLLPLGLKCPISSSF